MHKNNTLQLTIAFILGGLLMFAIGYKPGIPQAKAAGKYLSPYFGDNWSMQDAIRLTSAKLAGAIVEINVESEKKISKNNGQMPWEDFFDDPSAPPSEDFKLYRSLGMGSGVIIKRDGHTYYIVTNGHVIGSAENIEVLLANEETINGRLVGKDPRKDLAVVRIEYTKENLPVAVFGDSDTLYVGDTVLAFGSPLGYEKTVTSGIVSSLGRHYGLESNISEFIQTDASINQGNSGGPLVNLSGEIIGINTFIATPNRGSVGLGFALPSNNVKVSVRQIIDTGEVSFGWLGVSLGAYGPEAAAELGYPEEGGIMIYQVFDGSPAEKAGIKPGDRVLTFDGKTYTNREALIYDIGEIQPGEHSIFQMDRFGNTVELTVRLGERPSEDNVRAMHGLARPGFVPGPLTEDLREIMQLPPEVEGVAIAEVYPRTQAHAVDLRPGDILTTVNGEPIKNLPEMYIAMAKRVLDAPWYTVYRNGESFTLKQGQRP